MQTFQKGTRFGEWTVTESVTVRSAEHVLVQCSCGARGSVIANSLGRGKSLKCASCSRAENGARRSEERRKALEYEILLPVRFPSEYRVWSGMVGRCHGKSPHKDYGGRGIAVCEAWRSSFLRFLQDMGSRPGLEYSIDRVNVDGNYEPGNCRWATKSEQARNRRDSLFVEVNGERLHIMEAVETTGRSYSQLRTTACKETLNGSPRKNAPQKPGFKSIMTWLREREADCISNRDRAISRTGGWYTYQDDLMWLDIARERAGDRLCEIFGLTQRCTRKVSGDVGDV